MEKTAPTASSPCLPPPRGFLVRMKWIGLALLLLGTRVMGGLESRAGAPEVDAPLPRSGPVPGATLFGSRPLLTIRLRIEEADLERLRQEGRRYVPADVDDGRMVLRRVGLHLKGSSGSFQPIDRKPSLTLNFAEFTAGQRFHGLRKIHLNNAAEDPSYFNEFAGVEVFRAAQLPAPRVTHAVVWLNDRRLGLYVLKEGFTADFLRLHFSNPDGNLYEPEIGHDVDEAMTKERGRGPDDRRDLLALAAAAKQDDPVRRWDDLAGVLDRQPFVDFLALEVLLVHRDGYGLARNNFRIYHDPTRDRFVFFPHGMDQLFGRPEASIRPAMQGLVARAVMTSPAGRRAYRERLGYLVAHAFDVAALHRQAEAFLQRAQAVLEPEEFRALQGELTGLMTRMAARRQSLEQQLGEPEPEPLRFGNEPVVLTGWRAVGAPEGGAMDQAPAPDGRPALHVRAGPRTAASWRTRVLLERGRYRFHAQAFLREVTPLGFGRNQGAGLQVVPDPAAAPFECVGSRSWTGLERPFEMTAGGEVELACTLRAAGGEVWFDLESLRLEVLR